MGAEYIRSFVLILTQILWIALLVRVVLSWFNIGPSSPIYPIANIAHQVTEPLLAPIRRVLPEFGMFDFSPIVAFLLITLVQRIFSRVLN